MTRKLILHIGHDKTGSSAIQSMLASNAQLLEELGVFYPRHSSFAKARSRMITSGNGMLLLSGEYSFDRHDTVLLSSELLFGKVDRSLLAGVLEGLYRSRVDLEVIIYTRDLFEHSFSSWGQYIKRGGGTVSYEEFILRQVHSYRTYRRLEQWLDFSKELDFAVKVYNYERHKDDICGHFIGTVLKLNSEGSGIEYEKEVTVNRSLTHFEYELQRHFNKSCQTGTSRFISDELVNKLPDIKPQIPFLSREGYDKVVNSLRSQVLRINRWLDEPEKILITSYESIYPDPVDGRPDDLKVSSEQIEVLANSIGREIDSLRSRALTATDVDGLRDLAIKIENKRALTLHDALVLMKLARNGRPDGPFIGKKIAQWESSLGSTDESD